MFRSLLILLGGIPLTWPVNKAWSNPWIFLYWLKLNQSNKQNFTQGIKPPTIMEYIYVVNTRLL